MAGLTTLQVVVSSHAFDAAYQYYSEIFLFFIILRATIRGVLVC